MILLQSKIFFESIYSLLHTLFSKKCSRMTFHPAMFLTKTRQRRKKNKVRAAQRIASGTNEMMRLSSI